MFCLGPAASVKDGQSQFLSLLCKGPAASGIGMGEANSSLFY